MRIGISKPCSQCSGSLPPWGESGGRRGKPSDMFFELPLASPHFPSRGKPSRVSYVRLLLVKNSVNWLWEPSLLGGEWVKKGEAFWHVFHIVVRQDRQRLLICFMRLLEPIKSLCLFCLQVTKALFFVLNSGWWCESFILRWFYEIFFYSAVFSIPR